LEELSIDELTRWLLLCLSRFSLKQRNGGSGDPEAIEISVYDYFVKNCGIDLRYSGETKPPNLLPH
jgi:hypothetical protein